MIYTKQNNRILRKIFLALFFLITSLVLFFPNASFACTGSDCPDTSSSSGSTENQVSITDGEADFNAAQNNQTDTKIYLREPLPGQGEFVDVSAKTDSISILSTWIGHIFRFVAAISVIIAILVMMFAGGQLMFSGGDSGARETAKEMIMKVIMGISLLFMAGLILNFVNPKFYVFGEPSVTAEVSEAEKERIRVVGRANEEFRAKYGREPTTTADLNQAMQEHQQSLIK